ncbi:MAG TPA: carboxylesterase/lipase family protein [bacterium]|nr:carboxylesterase/lipase family protein [bacterium]
MNRKFFLNLLSASLVLCIFIFPQVKAISAEAAECAVVKTAQGSVSGTLNPKVPVCSYKGIPYAAPPVGALRWAMPEAPKPWKGVLAADHFRDVCMQKTFSLFGNGEKTSYEGSEDCLYLNIWRPAGSSGGGLPVMVFIHGGSLMSGAGSWELYDGTQIALRGNVILVTINYRLGPFGLLAHPALRDREGYEGNYSLYDQIAALKWVKKNIAQFGGDPANVTLFGESAGGMSVAAHLLSPLSRGLFDKAIIESGPQLFMGAPLKTNEDAAMSIAKKLRCAEAKTAAACLRRAKAEEVMAASNEAMTPRGGTVEIYDINTVMDDRIVFTNPYRLFAEGKFNKEIKIIIGSNRDEADLTAMSRPLKDRNEFDSTLTEDAGWAKKGLNLDLDIDGIKARYPFESYKTPRRAYSAIFTDMIYACPSVIHVWQLAANGATVYQYQFEKSPDDRGMLNDMGVFHAAELPFVFGNFSFMGLNFSSSKNLKLSKKVISLWTSFARDGIPAAEEVPEWPPYTAGNPAYLRIDSNPSVGLDMRKNACAYFDAYYKKAYSE